MKEELIKLYNERKSLEVKLENLQRTAYAREGKKHKDKMYKITIETREKLENLKDKIKFIENLSLEMEANEMFYKKK